MRSLYQDPRESTKTTAPQRDKVLRRLRCVGDVKIRNRATTRATRHAQSHERVSRVKSKCAPCHNEMRATWQAQSHERVARALSKFTLRHIESDLTRTTTGGTRHGQSHERVAWAHVRFSQKNVHPQKNAMPHEMNVADPLILQFLPPGCPPCSWRTHFFEWTSAAV